MLPFIHLLFSLKKTSKAPWSCLLSRRFLGWISFQVRTSRSVVLGTLLFHSQISRAGPKHPLLLFTPCQERFPSPTDAGIVPCVISSEIFASLHLRCSEGRGSLSPRPLATCCHEEEGLFARLWLPSGTSGLCSLPHLLLTGFHGISSCWCPFPQSLADGSDSVPGRNPSVQSRLLWHRGLLPSWPHSDGVSGESGSLQQGTELSWVFKIPGYKHKAVGAVPGEGSPTELCLCIPAMFSSSAFSLPAPHTALF